MITNHDRSGWFGASDSKFVMAKRRDTKSWLEWWNEKLGHSQRDVHTEAMAAGTAWEHKILDAVNPAIRKDHQIVIEKYRLRVNYDGDLDGTIYEVKTHNFLKEPSFIDRETGEVNTKHPVWKQCQVEMYAMKTKKLYIVAYGLIAEEYKDYSLPVDDKRIDFHRVEYDKQWTHNEYLPRLKELCRALRKGRIPT